MQVYGRNAYFRGCYRKRIYPKELVGHILGQVRRRYNDNTLIAYRCDFCHHYHIGHSRTLVAERRQRLLRKLYRQLKALSDQQLGVYEDTT